MVENNENNRLSDKSCVKVDAEGEGDESPVILLNEFYRLHVEINAEQGQIVAHATEAEQVLESKLAHIKRLRHSVKGKQKTLKELADKCGISISQLLQAK